MPPKKAQRVRRYALPGCCYEMPITIDDDKEVAPTRPRSKPISAHTATWLGELARGRREDKVNRPAVNAAHPTSKGSRKRAALDVDSENEEPRNGGAKRVRLSGGDRHRARLRPQNINQPSRKNSYHHLANINNKNAEDTQSELEAELQTRQREMDYESATVWDIKVAEEQARPRDEGERAREAELRDQQYQSVIHSSLRTMWRDDERNREAADERLRDAEWRKCEEAQRNEREAEEERTRELASLEASLKGMWEVHDLNERRTTTIRPGQLSEAGQRRVREREERLGRRRM